MMAFDRQRDMLTCGQAVEQARRLGFHADAGRRDAAGRLTGHRPVLDHHVARRRLQLPGQAFEEGRLAGTVRSEEHTSELQSLMRISYAVFCLKKKKKAHKLLRKQLKNNG